MSTDCIVIKIEQFSKACQSTMFYPDKTMYIAYDEIWNSYVIRGEICDDTFRASYFSFSSKKINSIIAFIQFNFDFRKKVDMTLLNYNDLPYDTDHISFDLLKNLSSNTSSVIAVHENIDDKKRNLKRNLKILRNVLNIYEESV